MDRWSRWLFYGNLVALAVLLLRFVLNDLYKTYRSLFAYFAAVLCGGSFLTQVPYGTNAYMHAYVAVEVLYHALAVFVVLELYRIALTGHEGLAKFARVGFLAATGLAIVVALAIALLDRNLPAGQSANVHQFLILQRSWDLVVVVFLVLIGLFITWFPVEMSQNTAFGIAGFTVVFFVRAGILLAANIVSLKKLPVINNSALILETVMTLAWTAAVRPEKVSGQVKPGHFWDPGAMDRLSQQLDSINAALGRFVRH